MLALINIVNYFIRWIESLIRIIIKLTNYEIYQVNEMFAIDLN